MFEVKVTVEIPGLPEAINALANAMSKTPAPAQATPAAAPEVVAAPVTPAPAANPTPAGAIQTAPASVPTAPYPTAAPTGATNPTQAAPAPAQVAPSATAPSDAKPLTMDDLGRAGATLIDAGKMPQLIALLGKYGVQAVTQLKPEHFNAFADELRALGAKF